MATVTSTKAIVLDTVQSPKSTVVKLTPTKVPIYLSPDYGNVDEQNFGEIEFMLENERKKFKEAKEKYEYDLDN
jgi:hypothetical protein